MNCDGVAAPSGVGRRKEGRQSKFGKSEGRARSDGDGPLAFDLTIPRGPIVVAACALPAASFENRFDDDAAAPASLEPPLAL